MFFFRTQYEQGSRKRPSEGITPAPGNTYMSYVLAKDEQEALVKMSNRNLNERFTSYCDPTLLEDVKPRDLVNALEFFDKQHYNYCLHAVTFMIFVLSKAGLVDPLEAISDVGVIHELIHLKAYPHITSSSRVRDSIEYVQNLYCELSH